MFDQMLAGLHMVLQLDVVLTIVLASIYGLVVGALPGLSATMATALLVPVTFYMSPIAAISAIIAASAMAIFSGDIPGCLLRIPGTPASAAYTDEAFAMTRKGQPELALGICLWFSALGGVIGTFSLVALAPTLAEVAFEFSTFEYFWLALLGLMCSTMVARSSPVKAVAAMFLGLLITCVGIENPAGTPRFTLGYADLLGGIEIIPLLVGVFAVSEVMRSYAARDVPIMPPRDFGSILKGQWALTKAHPKQQLRGNFVGIVIGVLPGAGADMAAWMSYAMSKRFSKTPEKFGTGHPEGLIEAGASNNASLASGWVPSLLFGIPGDTITAIAIGVLYMKGLNPGPTLFTEKASSMYALYIVFLLANIIMIPLGIIMIRTARYVLYLPRSLIMPVIVLLCAVGSFATGNNLVLVLTVAVFGLLGYMMDRNGFPVAALVLGAVMGTMVEQNFVTSLIKSDGSILPFFSRPVASVLALMTFVAMLWPLGVWFKRRLQTR
ncbi:MAG: C4-dicarboxylate ABC transporter permease [Betaproteobacteria bacterium]|nr:C4-dicarboxylate ABC transporter permease [Betaproteobacteria bacterium]NBS21968.1 C4-dicarboxylate ABC transporter permease [Betaproteobacteria bacterium]NBU02316.1 C4-dicarboxylate ABC transporter permease [Betaproteobacteria bacterium]NCU99019.1 C4-dicarboxylate ABC transporter permease [Betaproteobacteria bacterium]NCV06449.1 C4-dicarboxylate ABC transporter permease [Betaproteobacteria bacterium]